jgi:hypothetical protein
MKPRSNTMRSVLKRYTLVEALVAVEEWSALDEIRPRTRAATAGNALLAPFCDRAAVLMTAARGDRRAAKKHLVRALSGFREIKRAVSSRPHAPDHGRIDDGPICAPETPFTIQAPKAGSECKQRSVRHRGNPHFPERPIMTRRVRIPNAPAPGSSSWTSRAQRELNAREALVLGALVLGLRYW